MQYDPEAMKDVVCPLCGSRGTLRPIRPGRRFRAGPWSFLRLFSKSHECTACRAMFGTQELISGQKAA
jgi:hypothetical protein